MQYVETGYIEIAFTEPPFRGRFDEAYRFGCASGVQGLEIVMKTVITIYLTALHIVALGGVWLYTNDSYQLVHIEQAQCCNGDELTAFLTSQQQTVKRGK